MIENNKPKTKVKTCPIFQTSFCFAKGSDRFFFLGSFFLITLIVFAISNVVVFFYKIFISFYNEFSLWVTKLNLNLVLVYVSFFEEAQPIEYFDAVQVGIL